MNHNGVISLPTDGSSTYVAGQLVSLNANGQAAANGGTADAIGVVLHDVKATETTRPVDIQLFSAGGVALCQNSFPTNPIAIGAEVGYDNNDSVISDTGTNKIGYALEAASAAGTIRVILK